MGLTIEDKDEGKLIMLLRMYDNNKIDAEETIRKIRNILAFSKIN